MSEVNRPATLSGMTISGTGMALPAQVRTNADLEKLVDTNDEWIIQRTGIRQRYICSEGENTSTLATEAVAKALKNANLEPSDLDLVICATMTPDMVCPGTACQVVDGLGAVPCGAMDMNLACTGFVAALNTAANFIASGMYRHIAVVGAEKLSRIINWNDRNTCVLFGDGAGAAIVSVTDDTNAGCHYQSLHSDGSKWKELYVPRDKSQVLEDAVFNDAFETLQMNGSEVYKFAVKTVQLCLKNAMKACDLTADDIALVLPHQSNIRILESARDKLGIDPDKFWINIDRYGNTSAASVGLCLAEAFEQGRVNKGDKLVFIALGGGLTWATSVWTI